MFYDDDSGDKIERGPAFTALPQAGTHELLALELMHRDGARAEFRGAGVIPFTVADEATGEEYFEASEGARWKRVMGWPDSARAPNIGEVLAFGQTQEAKLLAANWDKLKVARDLDEAEARAQAAYEEERFNR